MKRLRITGGGSVLRRKGARLAAVAAALAALAAFTALPAAARHDGSGGWSASGHQRSNGDQQRSGDDEHGSDNGGQQVFGQATVNFRRNALFTCFGANGGTTTANTATITASSTTITAVVTVKAPAGTQVSGQLDQSRCARLKFFSATVPASGTLTTTVTDLRISGDAFVWFNDTAGDFQITPEVVF
jgi:hypothetical protein